MAALEQAMRVFWAKGYEGAQLADLIAAMGINPPSFYAAFQSKAAIYREAIALYLSTSGAGSMTALHEPPLTRDAIRAMLLASVEVALASPTAGGCMVSLGMVNASSSNAPLRDDLRALRRETTRLIRERLDRGVLDGDLPTDLDTGRLALFYSTIVQGLSLQAQDGASRDELVGIVDMAMMAL